MDISNFKKKIFEISNKQEFEKLALELFNYQINNNKFYKKYCDLLGFNTNTIKVIEDIPFLPIEFFKTEKILCQMKRKKKGDLIKDFALPVSAEALKTVTGLSNMAFLNFFTNSLNMNIFF